MEPEFKLRISDSKIYTFSAITLHLYESHRNTKISLHFSDRRKWGLFALDSLAESLRSHLHVVKETGAFFSVASSASL